MTTERDDTKEGALGVPGTLMAAETRERLAARVEQAERGARIGYVDWNLTTNALRVSRGVLRICGEDLDKPWQTPAFLERVVHPDDCDAVHASLMRAVQGGPRHNMDHRIITASGEVRWVHASAELDAEGEEPEPHLFGLMQDVTDRVQAQLELREALAETERVHERERSVLAAQRMEAVGMLAGGVAHDFNNVLTVILSAAQLLAEDLPEDDPLREDAREIVDAGRRAARLTRQLLAFSRNQVLEPVALDLDHALNDVAPMLRRLISENVLLELDLGSAPSRIFFDPSKVEQIALNLAVNARDAMPDGGRLAFKTRRVDAKDGKASAVSLEVSDTGCGMSEATAAHIFEPFFTTKDADQGTGLGLATVYGIVKQSGGEIRVFSEPDKGTRFCIHLPCASADQLAETRETTALAGEISIKATILVVEDDSPVRRLLKRVLKTVGHNVLVARDGLEAASLYSEHAGKVDLVISDVVMPGMSGPETVAMLREHAPKLPALFITGYSDGRPMQGRGNDEWLVKPFSASTLLPAVQRALATRHGSKKR